MQHGCFGQYPLTDRRLRSLSKLSCSRLSDPATAAGGLVSVSPHELFLEIRDGTFWAKVSHRALTGRSCSMGPHSILTKKLGMA